MHSKKYIYTPVALLHSLLNSFHESCQFFGGVWVSFFPTSSLEVHRTWPFVIWPEWASKPYLGWHLAPVWGPEQTGWARGSWAGGPSGSEPSGAPDSSSGPTHRAPRPSRPPGSSLWRTKTRWRLMDECQTRPIWLAPDTLIHLQKYIDFEALQCACVCVPF